MPQAKAAKANDIIYGPFEVCIDVDGGSDAPNTIVKADRFRRSGTLSTADPEYWSAARTGAGSALAGFSWRSFRHSLIKLCPQCCDRAYFGHSNAHNFVLAFTGMDGPQKLPSREIGSCEYPLREPISFRRCE